MGRTIPTFRMALEREIESWMDFMRGLRAEDRKYFMKIMDSARRHADSGSLSARPLLSEVIFMAQFIELEKKIETLEKRIDKLERSGREKETKDE